MADEYEDYMLINDLTSLNLKMKRIINANRKSDLQLLDNIDFYQRYHITKYTAQNVLEKISHRLTSKTEKNCCLTPEKKLCIALRYYATGSFQIVLGDISDVSQPSACRAVNLVSECLAQLSDDYITFPETESDRRKISQDFYDKYQFPGILGAIDCTHIPISSPGGERAEVYRNRKGFYSLNVQTISDVNLKIINIVARWPGSVHDSTIFDNSSIRARFELGVIPHCYHLLGDSGYPCRSYLLTPFLNPTTEAQKRYNAAHISARNVVERQYGVLKKRFPCLSSGLRCNLNNALTIIVATGVLHNIALSLNDTDEQENQVPSFVYANPSSHINNPSGIAKRNIIVNNYFT